MSEYSFPFYHPFFPKNACDIDHWNVPLMQCANEVNCVHMLGSRMGGGGYPMRRDIMKELEGISRMPFSTEGVGVC